MASLKDLIVLGPARFLDKIYGNLEGNASSADKLKTARSISLSGAVKGSATFDGSGNVGIATTFAQGMNYAGSNSDGGAAKSALKLVDSSNQGLTIGSATEPVYFSNGVPVKANTIENAKSAEYLSPGAKINGTNFTGSTDITTTTWGTARNIYIADSDSSHTGTAVSVNGSGNATLKLPSTIKATLIGNADSAYKLNSSVGLTGNSSNQNVFWNPFTWEINTARGGATGIYTLSDAENDFNGIFRVKFRNGNGATALSIKSVTWLSASTSTPPVLTLTTTVNSESITYKLYISSGTGTYKTYRISKIVEEGIVPTTAAAYTTSMTGTVQSTAEVIYASTASKLATARNIIISGTASSSVGTFNGSANTTIYIPLTIQGFNEIKTKKLTITSTEQVSHLAFSRGGWNYFTAPASGSFAFSPNGRATSGEGAVVTIDSTGIIPGNNNNVFNLGSSTYKWKNVYATTFYGALNGQITRLFSVDTSNAINLLKIYDTDGTTEHMMMGAHNTGNGGVGALYLIPYPRTKDAWSSEEGLYISKNLLKLDNNRIPTTGNTTGTVGSTSNAVYVDAGVIKEISTLAISKGGTGTSTAPTQGGVIYASSTSAYASTAAGSSGQLLQSAGTGKPTWITATNSNTASTVVKRDSSGGFSAGSVTLSGILTLTRTTDAETATDNGPALIVGGTRTTQHIEMDGNEIISKSNGTTASTLYLNASGGLVSIGSGGLSVSGGISTNNNITTTSASGGETSIRVTHGSNEYLYLWGNNSSGTRGLYDTTKGYVIQVTDTSTTFTGNVTGSSASCTGNAASATKLATARNIVLSGDFDGSASFNGTANATISATNYKCSVSGGNTNSFPYHRIAYITGKTGQWVDCDCILDIKHNYNNGGFGRIKVSFRSNGTGTAVQASATWLYKYNIKDDAISVAYWGTTEQSCYADVFYNHEKTYPRCTVYQVYGGRVWTLVDSNQPNDGATPTEAYTSISAAATALHSGTAYTNIVESTQANSVGILPISGGGTGANTPSGALSNLGGVGYTVVTNLSSLL